MGFCTKCGRPLQDGEICLCQQQAQQPQMTAPQPQQAPQPQMTAPQPQMQAPQSPIPPQPRPAGPNIGMELGNLVKGLFTSPVEAISSYTAHANIVIVAILIGVQAIVSMFVRLFRMLIANANAAASAKKDMFGYISDYYTGKTKVYETGQIFANMFEEVLVVIVSAAVIALVIWLLIKVFDKTSNPTYVQALSIYSVMSILIIPATVLSWVVGLTSVGFLDEIATCISVFANVMGYAFMYIGIRSICKQEKYVPLVMAVSFVAVNFISWIIGLMF